MKKYKILPAEGAGFDFDEELERRISFIEQKENPSVPGMNKKDYLLAGFLMLISLAFVLAGAFLG